MDFFTYANINYEERYKVKRSGFGTSLGPEGRKLKVEKHKTNRRELRATTLLQRRQITVMECPTPEPATSDDPKKIDRKTKLKQWKTDREKKLKEKFGQKPIFKVCCAPNVGFPALDTNTQSFAPKKHEFKPPKNIKPIKMNKLPTKPKQYTTAQLDITKKPSKTNYSNPVTRSQKLAATSSIPQSKCRAKKPTTVLNNKVIPTKNFKLETRNQVVIKNNKIQIKNSNKKMDETKSKDKILKVKFPTNIIETDNINKTKYKKTPLLTRQAAIDKSVGDLQIPDETSTPVKYKRKKSLHIISDSIVEVDIQKNINEKPGNKKTPSKRSTRKSLCKKLTTNSPPDNLENIKSYGANNFLSINEISVCSENNLTRNITVEPDSIDHNKENKTKKSSQNLKYDSNEETDKNVKNLMSNSNENLTVYSTPKHSYSLPDDSKQNSNYNKTPERKPPTVAIYISPFVTTTRGKGSTVKENKLRESLGIAPFCDYVSPTKDNEVVGAMYFHKVLDNIISRLLAECDEWNKYKENESVTDDIKDMIDVAVGQTNLLINKKFQQFRNLIYNCQNGDGEKLVTCVDLQGFWDMIYMQVENLDSRFKRLSDMKENNWEEIKPVIKIPDIINPVKKSAPIKAVTKKASVKPSSNIRAAIQAARKKAASMKAETGLNVPDNNEYVFDGGFFVVKSPKKTSPNYKTPNKIRKSLLVSVLSTEAKKNKRNREVADSPGAAVLRVSRGIKSIGKIDLNQSLQTPGKSILKNTSHSKLHDTSINKVVLFKDDNDPEDNFKLPNKKLNTSLCNTSEPDKIVRRSARLGKNN